MFRAEGASLSVLLDAVLTARRRPGPAEHLVLHLAPARRRKKKGVQWAEDVVDNEGLGKKSSKSEPPRAGLRYAQRVGERSMRAVRLERHIERPVPRAECCIFHKQRAFGEWSDGEDSDAECEQCQEQPS